MRNLNVDENNQAIQKNLILHNLFSIKKPIAVTMQDWGVQEPSQTELLYQVTDALNHYIFSLL